MHAAEQVDGGGYASTELAELRACARLNAAADAALELAMRERWPLAEAVDHLLPILGAHTGALACWLRTLDEDGVERDFHWTQGTGGTVPAVDSLAARVSEDERVLLDCGDSLVLAERLDVAGVDFGSAALVLAAAAPRRLPALLLHVWCEELDGFLAAIERARRKQRVARAIAESLRQSVLDEGIRRAVAALRSEVAFEHMMLAFWHEEDREGVSLNYKVVHGEVLVHDSAAPSDAAIDSFMHAQARQLIAGQVGEVVARLALDRYREEVLISGVRNEVVIGRLLVTSTRGGFNTFDRDLLQTFADCLRQRVVDFNREWKQLSLCFRRRTVLRLLAEEDYARVYLSPRERDTAMMFCDISGFTRISEQVLRRPSLIGLLIDTWGAEAVRIIWDTGGVFDKMVGDCVIGLWGPPFFEFAPAECCRRAAEAAWRIREFTHGIAAAAGLEALAGLDPPPGVATGLNYAPLMVGRYGPDEDYTGFSAGMNNTARLQGLAKRDEILCLQPFVDACGDAVQFGEARSATVKNVALPLAFRALLANVAQA